MVVLPVRFRGEDDDPWNDCRRARAGRACRAMDEHGPGKPWLRTRQASLYAGTPLLALVVVYWAVALSSNLNIGHRHLLPIYPALCILAGGAAFWIQRGFCYGRRMRTRGPDESGARNERRPARSDRRSGGSRLLAWRPSRLLAWHVGESVTIRPNYLAYFNQLAGGPSQGYKHLADSSLDWGQDLPALKRWLDAEGLQRPERGPRISFVLRYARAPSTTVSSRRASWRVSSIAVRRSRPPPLGGGVYCVSATVLDVISDACSTSPSTRATISRRSRT